MLNAFVLSTNRNLSDIVDDLEALEIVPAFVGPICSRVNGLLKITTQMLIILPCDKPTVGYLSHMRPYDWSRFPMPNANQTTHIFLSGFPEHSEAITEFISNFIYALIPDEHWTYEPCANKTMGKLYFTSKDVDFETRKLVFLALWNKPFDPSDLSSSIRVRWLNKSTMRVVNNSQQRPLFVKTLRRASIEDKQSTKSPQPVVE